MGRTANSARLYIPPGDTLASTGHASGIHQRVPLRDENLENFKMPRFLKVGPRTDTYRHGARRSRENVEAEEDDTWLENSLSLIPAGR